MKRRRVHIIVIFAALAVVATLISFAALTSRGQSRRSGDTTPKPTSKITERAGSPNMTAVFMAAAASNTTLRNELTWTFGGKQQRGWYLYESLIGRTIDSQEDAATPDFAASFAVWQRKKGLRLSSCGGWVFNVMLRQ